MPELHSLHPERPGHATFTPQTVEPEQLGNRAGKHKERGQLDFLNGYSQAVELFTRTVDAAEYAEIWSLFFQAGLPVVGELWQDGDGKIYMPDLTQDGSALYGKAFEQALAELPRTANDRLFVRIWQAEKARITAQAETLAAAATQAELLLPLDDPFDLQLFANGQWQLVILDLEYGGSLTDLLQRKSRYMNQRAQAPLTTSFSGRQLDSLNAAERQALVREINQRSVKTALFTLDSAATKLAGQH